MLTEKKIFAVTYDDFTGSMTRQHVDPFGFKTLANVITDFRVFTTDDPFTHLNLGDLTAEAGKGLCHLAANRAASENNKFFRKFA